MISQLVNNVNSKIDDYNNARPHKEGVTIYIYKNVSHGSEFNGNGSVSIDFNFTATFLGNFDGLVQHHR